MGTLFFSVKLVKSVQLLINSLWPMHSYHNGSQSPELTILVTFVKQQRLLLALFLLLISALCCILQALH